MPTDSVVSATKKNRRSAAKQILCEWAEQKAITPARFAQRMGYSYAHAWALLRGSLEPKPEMVGRMIVPFGTNIAERLAEALEVEKRTTQDTIA